MKISYVFPTYNERDHIVRFIRKTMEETQKADLKFEIILVDDNSPDGTGPHVQEEFAKDKRIKVIVRTQERGLATAILRGIQESSGTHIFLMDTDFNHDPKYLEQFFMMMGHYDIISGSRYAWGGNMEGGRFRYYGSLLFNYFLSGILHLKSTDNTGGFVLFKKSLLKKMHPKKIFFGYGEFFFRFLYAARLIKASLIEIPVVYSLRASGDSKTNFAKYIFVYTYHGLKLLVSGRSLIKK